MERPRPDADADALTGLRGAASLLVLTHHFVLRDGTEVAGLDTLLRHGYFAVDLFFVLSGFVMARAYGDWFTREQGWRSGAGAYLDFMTRRIARLWPLHTAVVLAILAHRLVTHEGGVWPSLVLSNLLMLQSWGISQAMNVPSWSVSTELAAYLLFPLLAGAALHGRREAAWAVLAGAVALLAVAIVLAPWPEHGRRGPLDIFRSWSLLPLLRCLGGFAIGMLACRALRWAPARRRLERAGVGDAIMATLLAGLAVGVPDVVLYPLLPPLVAAVQVGRGPLCRMLRAGPMQVLGVLSYALYLVHYPILDVLPDLDPAPLRFAVFLAVTVLVAALAHGAIERPGRDALRQAGLAMHSRLHRLLPG